MKKIVSLTLAAILAAGSLAGCGGNSGEGGTSAAESTASKASEGEENGSQDASGEGAGTVEHEPVMINFPTASASGALYAVGAAITNLWSTEIDFVNASSQIGRAHV